MSTKLRVRKTNKLNEARFRLTKNEYRILLLCVTQVKPKTEEVDSKYRIDVTEYAEVFGVSLKNAYKQVEEGLNSTWERTFFERVQSERSKDYGWRRRRFVITQEYFEGDGYGQVEFHPDFLQHLINLREQYTDYAVRYVTHLPSFNVIRMYELLSQYSKVGHRSFNVTWFRELLCLEDSYPRFGDLRTHVINPALKQIDEHTDLEILKQGGAWFTTKKRGRQVVSFDVFFRHKAQQTLDLEDSDEEVDSGEGEYIPAWRDQGYRTEAEFREARSVENRYHVSFDRAGDYYRFITKLRDGE